MGLLLVTSLKSSKLKPMPLDSEYGKLTGAVNLFLPDLIEILEVGLKLSGPELSDRVFGKDKVYHHDREPRKTNQIRAMILHLRLTGKYPIASDHEGYWMARTFEEIKPTIAEFRMLAQRKSIVAKQLSKVFEKENQTELL